VLGRDVRISAASIGNVTDAVRDEYIKEPNAREPDDNFK
jgi:hypothetical protein